MMKSVRNLLSQIETQRLAVLPESVQELPMAALESKKDDELAFLRD
jgi:hypothetical protein